MTVRIGIIGLGTFGINHLRAFSQMQREGKAVLAAACDLNEGLLVERQKAFHYAAYTNYKEMFDKEDLDGVTVVTPDHLHRAMALEALSRGIHCLVEKPLDVTVQGCLEMVRAAQASQRLLQVDFHKRWDPYHIELRREVSSGQIGEVEYGHVHMEDRIEVPRDWWPQWASRRLTGVVLGGSFLRPGPLDRGPECDPRLRDWDQEETQVSRH